jgi:replicative DNA helicase
MERDRYLLASLIDRDTEEVLRGQIKLLLPECFTSKKDQMIFEYLKSSKDITSLDPELLKHLMEARDSEGYETFKKFDLDSRSAAVRATLDNYKKEKACQYLDEYQYAVLNGDGDVQKELDKYVTKLSKLPTIRASSTIEDAAYAVVKEVKDCIELGKIPIKASQYPKLNRTISGGFRAGDIVFIFGPGGEGKTTFAQNLIRGFCKSGDMVLYCTTEMTDKQLAQQFLRIEATANKVNNVNTSTFSNPQTADLKALQYVADIVSEYYLTMTPVATTSDVLIELNRKPFDVIVVDHVHDLAGISDKDASITEEFLNELKNWALEHEKLVILLGQPRKQAAGMVKTRVKMDDIKYAQALQSKPSFIFGLFRNQDNGQLEVELLKSRWEGDVGSITPFKYFNGYMEEV